MGRGIFKGLIIRVKYFLNFYNRMGDIDFPKVLQFIYANIIKDNINDFTEN